MNTVLEEALNKNKADDIFKDIMSKTDKLLNTEEVATSYVQYKFQKTKILQDIARIKMLLKLGIVEGPIFIICQLRIIQL